MQMITARTDDPVQLILNKQSLVLYVNFFYVSNLTSILFASIAYQNNNIILFIHVISSYQESSTRRWSSIQSREFGNLHATIALLVLNCDVSLKDTCGKWVNCDVSLKDTCDKWVNCDFFKTYVVSG